jgi:hypothetical protein
MRPVYSPVPSSSIHLESTVTKCPEPFFTEVKTLRHRSHDVGKGKEVTTFAAEQRLRFEEWDHPAQQVDPATDDVYQRPVHRSAMVLADSPTPEPMGDEVENLTPLGILADMELRYELPPDPRTRVSLKRNVERPFAVYIAGDIRIQSFLLIIRTERIVTAHANQLRRWA